MSTFLAAISSNDLVGFVVWICIAGLVFWLLTWLVGYVGMGEPFTKIARAIIAIVAVLIIINALFSLTGHKLAW